MFHDRGTIKWTSLMLPEHVEMLKDMWQEDTKVQKPELDEQTIEIMEQHLQDAYYNMEPVRLSVFEDGEIFTVTGNIKQIDKQTKTIQLETDHTGRTITFNEIVDII